MSMYQAPPPFAPIPPVANVASVERRSLQLDFTPLLGGATVASCVTTLTDLTVGRGLVVEGLASPTVASPIITQLVSGSLLTVGHIYELEFLATMGSGDEVLQVLTIRCLR